MSDDGSYRAGLWVHEAGPVDAPLLVLVHGSLDRSAGLVRLSRRLTSDFRVIRFDRRGYGRSAAHQGPFTTAANVDDLVAVLDGRRAVLFGHSFGGNVVLGYAARCPELVDASVVYEAPLSWMGWWPTDTAGTAALGSTGDAGDAAEAFMRRLIGDERWMRLAPATRRARRAEGPVMLSELADLRARAPWTAASIECRVLALSGEHSAPHHRRAMAEIGDSIPNATAMTIAGARHFGPNTHASLVAETSMAWLADTGR